MENKIIKIGYCAECPFMIERGDDKVFCYLSMEDLYYKYTCDKVGESCPLKEGKLIIELDETTD